MLTGAEALVRAFDPPLHSDIEGLARGYSSWVRTVAAPGDGRPDRDWVRLAEAQGVRATRSETLDDVGRQLGAALAERRPHLVEVRL